MSPEIWRHIFDAIDDPIFLHDAEYRVLLANRAYCREAGVSEAETLGKPYWEVFPPGTGPAPGCKDAMSEVHTGSQEEMSVGARLFISTGYAVRDEHGKGCAWRAWCTTSAKSTYPPKSSPARPS